MKQGRNQSGFTLMEAMMAVFVLAIAAAGISMAFAAAGTVQVEAQRRVLASRLAADLMEKISGTDYGLIQATYPVGHSVTAAAMGNTGDAYANLSCSVVANNNIEVSSGGTAVKLIQVAVAASYGTTEITRITTLIGDKDKD
ncbi:MAG: prepilin-type N-terminal cleavage/methylation domain-containing protein [Planctomycetes bacterium]|nr:prepilin-type N-terminal cleavage/methylation domain-containing protein [Planctomycetota bacterium]